MVLVTTPQGAYFADQVYKALQKVIEHRLADYQRMDPDTFLYGWTAEERAHEAERFLRFYQHYKPVVIDVTRFANGEIEPHIQESVRGRDSYAFHSFVEDDAYNPDPQPIKLLNQTLHYAGASKIIDVLPNYPWQRQDRKEQGRVPISAKEMADDIQRYAHMLLTMDLHSEQQQGFFHIPVDQLYGTRLFIDYYNHGSKEDFVVVSPDKGGIGRAEGLAKRLGKGEANIVVVYKRRDIRNPNEVSVSYVVGEDLVPGKGDIIDDDMIDTGGTLFEASRKLRELGATYVSLCATHAILSPKNGVPALEMLCNSPHIDEIVVTDTIPPRKSYELYEKKLKVLPAGPLFAESVYEIQTGGSVSKILAEDRSVEDQ